MFQKGITENLGLTNTQIGIHEEDYSKLYLTDEQSINCLWELRSMESEGGGYSTVNDLLAFSQLILQDQENQAETTLILKQLEEKTIQLNETESIAQGWRIHSKSGTDILYHDGGSRGYKSFIGIDKKHNMSVVVLSQNCGLNKNNHPPKGLGIGILDQLAER